MTDVSRSGNGPNPLGAPGVWWKTSSMSSFSTKPLGSGGGLVPNVCYSDVSDHTPRELAPLAVPPTLLAPLEMLFAGA
jgi:hypothetical protein